MNFVRPEAARALLRWREVAVGISIALLGLWIFFLGGIFMESIGALVLLAGVGLSVGAARRMRFRLEVDAPGVVEIDEGQISYLGPIMGGSISLSELSSVQVLMVAGRRRCWRLRQIDGQSLLVPLAAAGADALYDVFSALPGANQKTILAALNTESDQPQDVWARGANPLLAQQFQALPQNRQDDTP